MCFWIHTSETIKRQSAPPYVNSLIGIKKFRKSLDRNWSESFIQSITYWGKSSKMVARSPISFTVWILVVKILSFCSPELALSPWLFGLDKQRGEVQHSHYNQSGLCQHYKSFPPIRGKRGKGHWLFESQIGFFPRTLHNVIMILSHNVWHVEGTQQILVVWNNKSAGSREFLQLNFPPWKLIYPVTCTIFCSFFLF